MAAVERQPHTPAAAPTQLKTAISKSTLHDAASPNGQIQQPDRKELNRSAEIAGRSVGRTVKTLLGNPDLHEEIFADSFVQGLEGEIGHRFGPEGQKIILAAARDLICAASQLRDVQKPEHTWRIAETRDGKEFEILVERALYSP